MKDILFVTEDISTPLESVYLSNNNSYERLKEEFQKGRKIMYGLVTDLVCVRRNSKTLNALLCPFKICDDNGLEDYFKGYMNNITFDEHEDGRPYYATVYDLKNVEDLYKAKYLGLFLVDIDGTVLECTTLIKIVRPDDTLRFKCF